MSVRRLHDEQPARFAFTPANEEWARRKIGDYPPGRQASAILPILTRAQEQEGWVTRPMLEYVADMLDMPYIRALEIATFYTQFQLRPVGERAHVQVCGTTPCMLRGSEELIALCRSRIHDEPFHRGADGALSWEEVECVGACVNAPVAVIGKDTYEDLTPARLGEILDAFTVGQGASVRPGPQIERAFSAPVTGATTLKDVGVRRAAAPAQVTPVPSAGGTPQPLFTPPPGAKDDLKMISGIGPMLEGKLNALGVTTFAQIAAFSAEDIAKLDAALSFKGRVTRDNWVGQAKVLAEGGVDAYRRAFGKDPR